MIASYLSIFIEFMGWFLVLGGCFGLGVWFTRWYDDRREEKRASQRHEPHYGYGGICFPIVKTPDPFAAQDPPTREGK